MPDQAVLNQAALVLAAVAAGQRADLALHAYLAGRRRGSWRERREIAGAVFAYYRWMPWLDRNVPAQRQLAQALALRERFAQDGDSVKAETLAARAVPAWLRGEMDLPPEFLRCSATRPSGCGRGRARGRRSPPAWGIARRATARRTRCATAGITTCSRRRISGRARSRSRISPRSSSGSPARRGRARRGGMPARARAARCSISRT